MRTRRSGRTRHFDPRRDAITPVLSPTRKLSQRLAAYPLTLAVTGMYSRISGRLPVSFRHRFHFSDKRALYVKLAQDLSDWAVAHLIDCC
jgi:hypothetical protein